MRARIADISVEVVDEGALLHLRYHHSAGQGVGLTILHKLHRLENIVAHVSGAVRYRTCKGVVSGLVSLAADRVHPQDGQVVDAPGVLGKAEVGVDGVAGAAGSHAQGLGHILIKFAVRVHNGQPDVGLSLAVRVVGDGSLSVPGHHEPLLVVPKLRSSDLGIFVQIVVRSQAEGTHQVFALGIIRTVCSVHGGDNGHNGLPVGGVLGGGIGIQGIDHSGGTVLQHGHLQALDRGRGAGAVIQGLGGDVFIPEHIFIPYPLAALADGIPDGVLLVKVGQIGGVGGFDLTPGHNDAIAAGGHHGGQVGGAVVGELLQRPVAAARGSGGHDLGGIYLEHLLTIVQGSSGDHIFGDVLCLPDPHGGVTAVRAGHLHIAVAVAGGHFIIAVEALSLLELTTALGGHGHTSVADVQRTLRIVALPVAEIEHDFTVIGQHRVGVGVGPGLEGLRQRGVLILVQAEQPDGGPSAQPLLFSGVHIVPALQLRPQIHGVHHLAVGHGHTGDGLAVDGLIGFPDLLDGPPPRIIGLRLKADGAEDLFIADEQEFEYELNAGGAADRQVGALYNVVRPAADRPHGADIRAFLQITAVEPFVLHIQIQLAEHTDLKGHH